MAHFTHEQLRERIGIVGQQVELGARYRHSKTGGEYFIKEFVIIEATEEIGVAYCPVGSEDIIWIRSVENFTEEIEIDGKKVPRFVKIS